MIHRNSKNPGRIDYHEGKWNGLGGKLELGESPLEAAQRELKEESGLDLAVDSFKPLGMLQFPSFKAQKNEDWVVFVFRVDADHLEPSQAIQTIEEGDLHWIPEEDLLKLNLWAGDHHFMPFIIKGQPLMGTIWYQGQEVVRHWVQKLGE